MRFFSAVSKFGDAGAAALNVLGEAKDGLGTDQADFAALFATAHYEDDFPLLSKHLSEAWPAARVIGCTAGGVIGEEHEIEGSPALTLFAGLLPGADIQGFHVDQADLEAAESDQVLLQSIGIRPVDGAALILLADPFSIDITRLLDRLSSLLKGCSIIGGLASGAERPGQNALLLDDQVYREGAVGAVLSGNVCVSSVVSQGCRPIGRSFVITKAEHNVILELGGKPALQRLKSIFSGLSPDDRALAESALFIGLVIDEYQDGFSQGDFLIRNLTGWDPDSGAIAIGDLARVGATVQFHVRDADSADRDLRDRLKPHVGTSARPRGALLFTCNGRGTRMWDQPDHDISCLRELMGGIPAGGFFCAGEIGPIGGQSFVHGHTASIALLGPRE